jgi:hypothetical protein
MSALDDVACLLAAANDGVEREVRTLYVATARAKLAREIDRVAQLQAILAAVESELARTGEGGAHR